MAVLLVWLMRRPESARRRGRRRRAGILAAATLVATAAIAAPAGAASGPTIGSDKADIARLEKDIAAQGEKVASLVERSNQVQARLTTLDARIGEDERHLAADQRSENAARAIVRKVAVLAYVNGGSANLGSLTMFSSTGSITDALAQGNYLEAVNGRLDTALANLKTDEAATDDSQRALRSDRASAQSTLDSLNAARAAANAAIAADNALLRRAKTNLNTLLAEAARKERAEELAKERALAARAITPPPTIVKPLPSPISTKLPRTPSANSVPPPPAPPSSPGAYANPFRGMGALTPQRIDQGVDYAGFGPIYAIGNGVVLSTSVPGWPAGTYIAYQLTDGPARGLVVFAAEDIQPSVQVGDHVSANSVIGQVFAGPDGIETGWGDPNAIGNTMARTYGQFNGGNSTAFGSNFSRLLQALGAPGGILQNDPPTGTLPSGWPTW